MNFTKDPGYILTNYYIPNKGLGIENAVKSYMSDTLWMEEESGYAQAFENMVDECYYLWETVRDA